MQAVENASLRKIRTRLSCIVNTMYSQYIAVSGVKAIVPWYKWERNISGDCQVTKSQFTLFKILEIQSKGNFAEANVVVACPKFCCDSVSPIWAITNWYLGYPNLGCPESLLKHSPGKSYCPLLTFLEILLRSQYRSTLKRLRLSRWLSNKKSLMVCRRVSVLPDLCWLAGMVVLPGNRKIWGMLTHWPWEIWIKF